MAFDRFNFRISRSFGSSRLTHLAIVIGWLGLAPLGCDSDTRLEGEPTSLKEFQNLGTLGEQQLVESDSEGSKDFGTHEEEVAGSWLLADSISEFHSASEVLV